MSTQMPPSLQPAPPSPEQRRYLKSLSGDPEFRKDLIKALSSGGARYDENSIEYDEGRDIWKVLNAQSGRWEDIAIEFDFDSWEGGASGHS